MLLSRLSVPNAKLFGATNPDSPFHWLKVNYIDRKDELDLKTWDFTLEDNPSLTELFKSNLKKEYRGVWYKRYIEGEWCLAEGVIYDFFDEKLHVIDFPPGQATEYIVGVDYGTAHPCVFTLLGYNPEHYPNMWIEKEYYYNSEDHNRQKTDSEYADDLKGFISNHVIKQIFIDPAAASFKLECQRQGIRNIYDANNDVLDGIRFVSSLFINGTLKICSQCANLRKEIQSYRWDDKSKMTGVDKPLKRNDDCCDSMRYAIFSRFGLNISPESRMTVSRLDRLRFEAEREGY
jgi:PBSX family phage terminase large subunit